MANELKQGREGQRRQEGQHERQQQAREGEGSMARRREGARGGALQRGGGAPMGFGGGGTMSPFSFMRRMMEDMDRMFEGLGLARMGGALPELEQMRAQAWAPEIEVFQREGNLVVRADLPGMTEDDVEVNIDDEGLELSGERRHEEEHEEGGVYHSERSYGSFRRRIPLPAGVDPSTCDASFENGVLEVKLRMPERGGRKIQVRGGGRGGEQAREPGRAQDREQPQSREAQRGREGAQREGSQENGTQGPPPRH